MNQATERSFGKGKGKKVRSNTTNRPLWVLVVLVVLTGLALGYSLGEALTVRPAEILSPLE